MMKLLLIEDEVIEKQIMWSQIIDEEFYLMHSSMIKLWERLSKI